MTGWLPSRVIRGQVSAARELIAKGATPDPVGPSGDLLNELTRLRGTPFEAPNTDSLLKMIVAAGGSVAR